MRYYINYTLLILIFVVCFLTSMQLVYAQYGSLPSNLSISATSNGCRVFNEPQAILSWQAQNATNYIIWKSNDGFIIYDGPNASGGNNFVFSSGANGDTLSFGLRATNNVGFRYIYSNTITLSDCAPYHLYTLVFMDTNDNGVPDGSDYGLYNFPVYRDSNGPYYTSADGTYDFGAFFNGTSHTISISTPPGYQLTTPGSYTVGVAPSQTVYFGLKIPPPPTVTPNPPTVSCSGNNVQVSFNYSSSGATWYQIYWNGDGSLLYNGASTSFTQLLPPNWSRTQNIQYDVRAFYDGSSGVYSSTITTPVNFPDCYYAIYGNVFVDLDRTGTWNGPDYAYANGATVTLAGAAAGTRTTDGGGAFSFLDLLGGNYTLTLTAPSTYVPSTATQISYTPLSSVMTNQYFGIIPTFDIPEPTPPPPGGGPQATPTPGPGVPTPTLPVGPAPTNIGGIVFNDHDRSSTYTNGDTPYTAGATVRLSGSLTYGNPTFTPQTDVTNGNGLYGFYDLYHGTYTLQLDTSTIPTRYQATTATTSNPITLPPDSPGRAFGIVPRYSISGVIFDDRNKDGQKNGAEPTMSGNYTVTINGVPYTAVNGVFNTGNVLYEGIYTVSYTSAIPNEYKMTYPLNGPPPSFTVTLGRNCDVSSVNGASCVSAGLAFSASDITNVNFGMSNYTPWFQVIGSSGRIDDGIITEGINNTGYTDVIPVNPGATCGFPYASTTNGVTTTPGVIYSDTSINLGVRGNDAASTQKWIVENDLYSTDQYRTSYDYITATLRQSGVTATNLNAGNRCGASGISNCTLSPSLSSGVYIANGDLNLNAYTFPLYKNYVILVNGDLHINDEIHIPIGSTALFSVSGDIIIASDIGESNVCSTTTNVEGFFSTDGSFIIDGINNCAIGSDLRFNLGGAIVTNAAGTTTGSTIENRRDLCSDDRNAPSFAIFPRPDIMLYIPEFLKYKSDAWREVAP